MDRLSENEKGLMDMDNSVVIAGTRGVYWEVEEGVGG